MVFIELKENDSTYRLYTYRGQPFRRLRNDSTGNYGIYEQYLPRNKTQQLKTIYGTNGDVTNVSSSLLLRFPSAKKHNVKRVLREQVLAAFKAYDKTSVLSTFEVDTSQHYEDGVYIYLNVSWAGDDIDAVTKSDTLLNNIDAIIANMSTTSPQPFNSVVLSTSLNPVTMKCFVLPTILSITTTYVEDAHNTDVEVKTVGLYDHIGIKINTEDDNEFRRLRNQQITTAAEYYDLSNPGGYDNILNIVGVDPTEDTFIATLFDNDYKKLYTSIQTPTIYIQQTQGTNGDLLNETVDGSITLDLNFNDFTTENHTDFIDTMNSETGGDTTIVNTSEGSAIVEYRVIFDVSKTQQEIDDVVTKLNDDVEIQNIINKSATMNGVVARKTVNKTTKRERRLTKKTKVFDVVYDEPNSKILFKTIGSYNHILYKATEQDTFLSTTNKIVDLPPGFTNKIDVKLVDVTDGDITAVKTYSFDITPPFITLNGEAQISLYVGDAYVEQGATVSDNSGETITPIISGTIDVNTVGTYTLTYTATDSSGNTTSKNRSIIINPAPNLVFAFDGGQLNNEFWSLTDKTVGKPWEGNDAYKANMDMSNTDWIYGLSIYFYGEQIGNFNNNYGTGYFSFGNLWGPGGPGIMQNQTATYITGTDTYQIQIGSTSFMSGNHNWLYVFTPNTTTTATLTIYKNAVLIGTITEITYVPADLIDRPVRLGNAHFAHTNANWDGNISNVKIWNTPIDWNTAHAWDTTAPVITLNGDADVLLALGDPYVELGASVTDNSGETIPPPVISGTVDVDTGGTYEITYTATDSSGNQSVAQRTVIVISPQISLAYNPTNIKWTKTDHGSSLSSTTEYVLMSNGVMTIQTEHNDIQWSLQPNILNVDYDTQWSCYFGFKAIGQTNSHWFIVWFDPTLTTDATWPPMDGNFILPDSSIKHDPFAYTRRNNLTKTMLGILTNDQIRIYGTNNIFGSSDIQYTYSNSFNTALSSGNYIYFEFKRQSDGLLHLTVYDNDASIILTVTSLSPYNFIYKESPFAIRSIGNTLVFDKEIMFDTTGTKTIYDYIGQYQ